jgi:transposase
VGGKKFLHDYNALRDDKNPYAGAPMALLQLSDSDRDGLQHLLSEGTFAKEHCRVQALLWLAAGEPVERIADVLGVSRRAVYYWAERFQERGELNLHARLADAPRCGRPATVAGIIDPLLAAVIDLDPRDLGYRSTGWTNRLLRQHLQKAHHLAVSRKSVSLALARLGIRWKRPRHELALRPDTWRQSKGGSNAASRDAHARCC